jgi:asparagine synthase (glutamine-hydrolysing)
MEHLGRRGPDGSSLTSGSDWVLGHTRLAILDLTELAAQPMQGRRGTWIVFNGEIYNFQTIREELRAGGIDVRSTGDTEVLLAALEFWGAEGALGRLRGMFAFAWLDPARRTLVLARDRYGVKPLAWERTSDGVLFASDLVALDALAGGVRTREVDPESAQRYLMLGYVPAPYTIWHGPRKLLPGHFLSVDWSPSAAPSIREQAYWSLRDVPSLGRQSPQQCYDGLPEKLRDAVSLRLVSDVPVGLLLSGGIDSTLVGAVCSEVPGANVPTFTMGFDDPASDERPYARAVAAVLNLRHTDFVVSPEEIVGAFAQLWEAFDEPFADSSALPMLLLCREIRKHVKVVMGGDGGDEVWCGYPWHRALSKFERIARAPKFFRGLTRGAAGAAGAKWRYLARVVSASDRLEAWAVLRTGLTTEMARFLPVDAASRPATDCFRDAEDRVGKGLDALDWACRMDLITYLPDDLLVKADRASMAVGLEMREPLLDSQFTVAALGLPSSMRFDRNTMKGKTFARGYLAGRVPRSLLERPKQGFTPPLEAWLRGPLRAAASSALRDLEAGALYPLRLPKGMRSWDECAAALDDANRQFLWRIICFWGWLRARQGSPVPAG